MEIERSSSFANGVNPIALNPEYNAFEQTL
jgi:hypothetical protein